MAPETTVSEQARCDYDQLEFHSIDILNPNLDVAASFGGSNIDSTAWEDKKCKGESRFPAQVRIRVRKLCKALEEDAFRPVLHHYDGPKFRLELSVPETLDLLDLCEQSGV
ncbi:B2 protein [Forsythia ovata]|uniref:B2 protein n=1 Tax=Forsythia ovata TaxID=205694 RepID=A0ABD1NXI1_9LAMI